VGDYVCCILKNTEIREVVAVLLLVLKEENNLLVDSGNLNVSAEENMAGMLLYFQYPLPGE
jgi:hypothetical protein